MVSDDNVFTHSSVPQAVRAGNSSKRKKYRDVDISTWNGTNDKLNIMCDPRVVRGSTYSKHTAYDFHSTNSSRKLSSDEKEQKLPAEKKKKIQRRKIKSIYEFELPDYYQSGCDLSHILVEKEKVVLTSEEEAQTDAFIPLKSEEPFIPMKTGIDNFTHMDKAENPFDFDFEVIPLLDTLVNKTIQQATEEVEEEEELKALRIRMNELYKAQEIERNRIKEMEDLCAQGVHSVLKEMQTQRLANQNENKLREKILASTISKFIIGGMTDDIFAEFNKKKAWSNSADENISMNFMPWLLDNVSQNIRVYEQSKTCINGIVHSSFNKLNKLVAEEKLRVKKGKAAEAERKRIEALKVKLDVLIPGTIIGEDSEDVIIPCRVLLESDDCSNISEIVLTYLSSNTSLGDNALSLDLTYTFEDIDGTGEKSTLTVGSPLIAYNIPKQGARLEASLA